MNIMLLWSHVTFQIVQATWDLTRAQLRYVFWVSLKNTHSINPPVVSGTCVRLTSETDLCVNAYEHVLVSSLA